MTIKTFSKKLYISISVVAIIVSFIASYFSFADRAINEDRAYTHAVKLISEFESSLTPNIPSTIHKSIGVTKELRPYNRSDLFVISTEKESYDTAVKKGYSVCLKEDYSTVSIWTEKGEYYDCETLEALKPIMGIFVAVIYTLLIGLLLPTLVAFALFKWVSWLTSP